MNKELIVKKFLEENNADAIIFSSFQNRFWLTDAPTSAGIVFFTKKRKYFLVDSRYQEVCKKANFLKNIDQLLIVNRGLSGNIAALQEIIKQDDIKSILVEGDYLTVEEFKTIKNILVNLEVRPLPTASLREQKDAEEIARIKHSANFLEKAYAWITQQFKVGITEIEIRNLLNNYLNNLGAEGFSFDTIVAFGTNAANPHHNVSNKQLELNSCILIDFGVKYRGYCSDMTRTCFFGPKCNQKLISAYQVVLDAQKLGVASAKSGISCKELDKIVRDYITEKGYGEYYIHGLGHALGIDVHEAPFINQANDTILKEGHVITIEPGVYIPGVGGIRIEDDILIKKDNAERLTNCPKELLIIK